MNERIESFLKSRQIAVVGVSKRKFGGVIYKTLKKRGINVCPVHPGKESFDGDKCYPDLKSVPDTVDAAVIAVSPANAEKVVADAWDARITRLWFQSGANFSRVVERAEASGLQTVSRRCVLMYAPPVTGIHAIHRFIARLFGVA